MKPLVTPLVNLNGTSAQELIDQRMRAYTAIDDVIDAMYSAMPHGRDYQTSPDGWQTPTRDAQEAWRERIRLLREIRSEICADALAIQDQQKPTETAFMAFWRANKEAYATFGEAQDAWRMIQQQ